MRWLFVPCLVLVAACDLTADVELRMNVSVSSTGVALQAREVERSCTCSAGEWVEIGDCGGSSDGISCDCDPPPAACLTELRVVRDGETVATEHVESWFGWFGVAVDGLATSTDTDAELVVVGCGAQATIPISGVIAPVPELIIDNVGAETTQFTWSATPAAASAAAWISDGYTVYTCHGTVETIDLPTPSPVSSWPRAGVTTYAEPVLHETALGEARVWFAGDAEAEITPPAE